MRKALYKGNNVLILISLVGWLLSTFSASADPVSLFQQLVGRWRDSVNHSTIEITKEGRVFSNSEFGMRGSVSDRNSTGGIFVFEGGGNKCVFDIAFLKDGATDWGLIKSQSSGLCPNGGLFYRECGGVSGDCSGEIANEEGKRAPSCDELASSPSDAQRPAGIAGVNILDIDVDRALPVCLELSTHERNEPRVAYQIGRIYDKRGSYDLAALWYQKASGAAYTAAQSALGILYQRGQGVKVDYATALSLFDQAAKKGSVQAQESLGWMYENGEGIAANLDAAKEWYRKAASNGSAYAQSRLIDLQDKMQKQAEQKSALSDLINGKTAPATATTSGFVKSEQQQPVQREEQPRQIQRQPRQMTTIEYYVKTADGNRVLQMLRAYGATFNPVYMSVAGHENYESNALACGAGTDISKLKGLARYLLRAGFPLKSIFEKPAMKSNKILILNVNHSNGDDYSGLNLTSDQIDELQSCDGELTNEAAPEQ